MSTPPLPPVPPVATADGKNRRLSCGILIFLLLAGVAGAVYLYWTKLTPGWFHTERMNAIVEAVRRYPVGEKEVSFNIEDLSHPETLAQTDPQHYYGNVWAHRRDGVLQVAIMTQNSGHLGEYGFVFSEAPLTVKDQMGGQNYHGTPGPMTDVGGKVSDHWWRTANRER